MSTALTVTTPPTETVEFSAFGNIQHFENAQRMAKALCSSSIVPLNYQGEANLGSCVIALEISNRIGASVLAVMQNLYVVHGKPGWSSQFLISCVNASRKFTPLRYKMTGEKGKDSWGCIAWAEDKTGEILESPEVTIDMAKQEGWYGKNGSKWKTMPELMLRYRTATLFARLYAPELTMGIQTAEEIADVIDVDATVVSGGPSFTPKAKAAAPVVEVLPEPAKTKPNAPQELAKHPKTAPVVKTPDLPVQEPEKPAMHPTPHDTALPAAPEGPLGDLTQAMTEAGVSTEQLLAFAGRKGILIEGADKDLAVMSDILPGKIPMLTKLIRTKGQALKEMKGEA